jgi:integrase
MASGYIRERTPGRFTIEVYAGRDPMTGKKRWLYKTVKGSRSDAEHQRNLMLVQVGSAGSAGTETTLSELMELWIDTVGLSEGTEYNSRLRKKRHVDGHPIAATKIYKLRVADLAFFYAHLRKSGLGAATVARVHTDISAALGQAVRWEWIARNPAHAAAPRGIEQPDPQSPETADVHAIMAEAAKKDPETAVFIALDAVAGARRGEMCALRWNAIDLENGWLEIRAAIATVPGRPLIEKPTKTRRPTRIRLGQATVDMLKAHRIKMIKRALVCRCALADDAFVFSDEVDCSAPWRPDSVSRRFRVLREKAGVDGIQLRQLRHYVASELGDAGVPVGKVSKRLNHARVSTTLNVYSKVFVERDDASAAIMDKLVHGAD